MPASNQAYVYIGSHTTHGSEGIYLSLLDLTDGRLTEPVLVADISNPTFLTTDPRNRFLFCTRRDDPSANGPCLSGFAISSENGALTPLNSQYLAGASYCHISTDAKGEILLAADYGSGNIAAFPIASDGRLGQATTSIHHTGCSHAVPDRQDVPHLHSINMDISNRYAFVCDFSADEVSVYRYEGASQPLAPVGTVKTATGAGPRHLVTHPEGKFVYVINELNGTITGYTFDVGTGSLQELQTVATLPADFAGHNTCAEIAISPDRRFLYGSNRGHDSLACFALEQQSGRLIFKAIVATGGQHPRNFAIDPGSQFLLAANRDTDNVVIFRIDQDTGIPHPSGQELQLSMPMGIKIIRA